MKNQFLSLFLLIISANPLSSQCDVRISNRSDGVRIKYLNPELIGGDKKYLIGLSVSTNGESYFLSVDILYSNNPLKIQSPFRIITEDNSALELKMYRCEMAKIGDEIHTLGIFYLNTNYMQALIGSNLRTVVFTDQNNLVCITDVKLNKDILKKQIKVPSLNPKF